MKKPECFEHGITCTAILVLLWVLRPLIMWAAEHDVEIRTRFFLFEEFRKMERTYYAARRAKDQETMEKAVIRFKEIRARYRREGRPKLSENPK